MHNNSSKVVQAVDGGLGFILAQQSLEGYWTDWDLPPGSSSIWTTAYIGYKLKYLPEQLREKAADRLASAAYWLLCGQFAGGGWGYNESVGVDADSTAFSILFLASTGLRVPQSAYSLLARHQNPDGGFCTYLPEGNMGTWCMSHPDVTPVALSAFQTQAGTDRRILERGLGYALSHRNSDGSWNSFWWNSWLYGTEANLGYLREIDFKINNPARLSTAQPANAFETALLLSCLLYAAPYEHNQTICDLTDWLIAKQQTDGGWETAPFLRITDRNCIEPWLSSDPGPLFADPSRLFTTATVIHALSRTV